MPLRSASSRRTRPFQPPPATEPGYPRSGSARKWSEVGRPETARGGRPAPSGTAVPSRQPPPARGGRPAPSGTAVPSRQWRGLSVLITSGPTREYLDPVRFLTNASSGRMGRELAAAALRLGASVTVVSGPSEVPPPPGARVIRVLTAEQMRRETLRRAPSADVVIGAAAVSDWRFSSPSRHKLKRGPGPLRLTLTPNPDIIKEAAARRSKSKRGVTVGFALETRGRLKAAREKLRSKGLDLVVANGPAAVGAGRARFDLVGPKGAVGLGLLTKREASRRILAAVAELL